MLELMKTPLLVTVAIAAALAGSPVQALDASDFDEVVGWTVLETTQVEDEFEGCDFDKKIRLTNGWVLTCSTYSYSYSYRPEVVIFVKSVSHQGQNFWMVKALIDDEFYDMRPIRAR